MKTSVATVAPPWFVMSQYLVGVLSTSLQITTLPLLLTPKNMYIYIFFLTEFEFQSIFFCFHTALNMAAARS